MTCLDPRLAYKKTNGQYTLAKIGTDAPIEKSVLVPCGQCMSCRINHQREWATRMVHEAQMHENPSSFLTLTVDDEHRLPSRSVNQKDMQLFIKRLRKHLAPQKIRVYYVSEYGETSDREHYHAIIFGWMPTDRKNYKKNKQGDQLYTSELLNKLWGKGFVTIGDFNITTAEYCAKYVTKAILGKNRKDAYKWTDPETGEVHHREPPFQRSSNRPGLGATFYEKYKSDIYPHDYCVIDGVKRPVPKFYDRKLKKENPNQYDQIKQARNQTSLQSLVNDPHKTTITYREAKEIILNQRLANNKRDST